MGAQVNALQLLRQLGLEHPTPEDLRRADEALAEVWHAAADLVAAADMSLPDPMSVGLDRRKIVEAAAHYARRHAAFVLRMAVPPSQRLYSCGGFKPPRTATP